MSWPTTSSASRGYGAAWRRLREIVMKRDHRLCQTCLREGRVTVGNTVDHIRPKAKGGTDALTNLQVLCEPHHQQKSLEEVGKRQRRAIGVDGVPVDGW